MFVEEVIDTALAALSALLMLLWIPLRLESATELPTEGET
jgi:hypothetical protein